MRSIFFPEVCSLKLKKKRRLVLFESYLNPVKVDNSQAQRNLESCMLKETALWSNALNCYAT